MSNELAERLELHTGSSRDGSYTLVPKDLLREAARAIREAGSDTARLDYIERTFSGMTNRERYLPVQMIWGNGCNGRTLREACDKYMKRDTPDQERTP